VEEARELIARLLPDLRGYARFLVRDRASADDLVQEALLRALAALPQFRHDGSNSGLRGWLFTILRNTFYEQARRRRTERAVMARAPAPEQGARPAQHGHLALSELQRHLFELPPLFREALVLVGAHGLSYEEAASICNVPVGTVKARVSRGRTLLARVLARDAAADPAVPASPS
jgi:RNA polymerase sigma-70 factor, ECF subfamily